MKLLYLSCHSILEYDELKIFEELGIDYFSLGSYIDPKNPVDPIRPALRGNGVSRWQSKAPLRDKLTAEFLDDFDVIIVMHIPEWIEKNWEVLRGRNVIWRTIGQSTASVERRLRPFRDDGLKVVRYSPAEIEIPENIGADVTIRFYKDPDEFFMWNGTNRQVVTLAQNMKHRGEFCNYDAFLRIINGFPAKLYGTNNEESGELSGGFLTYEAMRQMMRDNRVYIYTGTQPASYTLNFIEALMTGIPMVCLGSKFGTSLNIAGDAYEVPEIIQNGVNGFVSDDINYLREKVQLLLDNPIIAKKIGAMGRETAIKLFGKDTIKQQWKQYFERLGYKLGS